MFNYLLNEQENDYIGITQQYSSGLLTSLQRFDYDHGQREITVNISAEVNL